MIKQELDPFFSDQALVICGVFLQPLLLMFGSTKLPESDGACSGDIQRIDSVLHGDTYRIITALDGLRHQTVTLGTEKDRKPGFPVQ